MATERTPLNGGGRRLCMMSCLRTVDRKPLVDFLAMMFGVGAWVAVNGLWVELPLLVTELPEGWNLPSYLSIIIQVANVGPIAYSVLRSLRPTLRPTRVVYGVLAVGCVASLLLALLWQETTWVGGTRHSTALLCLVFLLALVDCTSSVLFMPYMAVWHEIYLSSYLVGEGLSGLLPALLSLAQGVGGNTKCENVTVYNKTNNFTHYELQPVPLSPRFSVTAFFFFLMTMMVASGLAFTLLEHLPSIRGERAVVPSPSDSVAALATTHSNTGIMSVSRDIKDESGGSMAKHVYWLMLAGQAWVSSLTNGVFPSIQPFSCGAYGNVAYHLSVTLSSVANPLAAFTTLVLPRARKRLLTALGLLGTLISMYIMATAALSPYPPLMGTAGGVALVVLAWVVFTGVMTYVRVEIANQMREEGWLALFWCGAVTQGGSAVGAVIMFILINVYNLFTAYKPC